MEVPEKIQTAPTLHAMLNVAIVSYIRGGMLEGGGEAELNIAHFCGTTPKNHRNEILSTFPKSLSISLYICTAK